MSDELKMILESIKADITLINKKLDNMSEFNWKFYGVCIGVAGIVSLLFKLGG